MHIARLLIASNAKISLELCIVHNIKVLWPFNIPMFGSYNVSCVHDYHSVTMYTLLVMLALM